MFFVSEEYLRRYKETGDVGGSTLGEVAPLGMTLFPANKEVEHLPKAKRGPRRRKAISPPPIQEASLPRTTAG